MSIQRRLFSLVAGTMMLGSSVALASEAGSDGIGFYTAVAGQVGVTHPGDARLLPVKLHDQVLFKDVIETQYESRTKAFFQDDSILTVGENSRVEINEYIYKPEDNVRRAVVKLVQGQVRALVSKVFKANGSRFEVHTPSAVAAARGTYFTVWVQNGQSGIINIGETGRVDFTAGGTTVAVDPGYFSVAKDGEAPSIPVRYHIGQNDQQGSPMKRTNEKASNALRVHDSGTTVGSPLGKLELTQIPVSTDLAQALSAVELTMLQDEMLAELPAQVLQALSLDTQLVTTLATLVGSTTEVLSGNSGGTTALTTSTLTTGALTVGPVSVGTTTTSGGAISVGSLSVGSVSVGATTVAPLTSVVSTVVAPVISPVVAPMTPLVTTIIATPPAVINGALNVLK